MNVQELLTEFEHKVRSVSAKCASMMQAEFSVWNFFKWCIPWNILVQYGMVTLHEIASGHMSHTKITISFLSAPVIAFAWNYEAMSSQSTLLMTRLRPLQSVLWILWYCRIQPQEEDLRMQLWRIGAKDSRLVVCDRSSDLFWTCLVEAISCCLISCSYRFVAFRTSVLAFPRTVIHFVLVTTQCFAVPDWRHCLFVQCVVLTGGWTKWSGVMARSWPNIVFMTVLVHYVPHKYSCRYIVPCAWQEKIAWLTAYDVFGFHTCSVTRLVRLAVSLDSDKYAGWLPDQCNFSSITKILPVPPRLLHPLQQAITSDRPFHKNFPSSSLFHPFLNPQCQ